MKEQLLKQVEQKAYKYEQDCWDCSQCTLLAIQEAFGLNADDAVKAATGSREASDEGALFVRTHRRCHGIWTPLWP
jgi:hypothetical protein